MACRCCVPDFYRRRSAHYVIYILVMNEEYNPYAAPKSSVLTAPVSNEGLPLASRWHRLVASFLDSLILGAIFMPAAQILFCKSGDQVWDGSAEFMLR